MLCPGNWVRSAAAAGGWDAAGPSGRVSSLGYVGGTRALGGAPRRLVRFVHLHHEHRKGASRVSGAAETGRGAACGEPESEWHGAGARAGR